LGQQVFEWIQHGSGCLRRLFGGMFQLGLYGAGKVAYKSNAVNEVSVKLACTLNTLHPAWLERQVWTVWRRIWRPTTFRKRGLCRQTPPARPPGSTNSRVCYVLQPKVNALAFGFNLGL
jgi:hypothetical protein